MSLRDSGSIRYFKAQLRPLMKPTLWASAGLVGLSLFVLVKAFREPQAFWQEGDRDAAVNLDNSSALTPEERAQAAELDDLSVLLKDLDERGTIDSVTARPNGQTPEDGDALAAIADNPDLPALDPSQALSSSSAAFESLPLLDLSPRAADGSSIVNNTAASGFSGFDPRVSGSPSLAPLPSSGSTLGSSANSPLSPLGEALQRYGPPSPSNSSVAAPEAAGQMSPGATAPRTTTTPYPTNVPGSVNLPRSVPAPLGGILPNGGQAYGGFSEGSFDTHPALPQTGSSLGTSQRPVQNSADNAYIQLLNPNLVVPAAPFLPNASGAAINRVNGTNFLLPPGESFTPSPTPRLPTALPPSPNPVFSATPGAPVFQPLSPTPAPFSVPNGTPGQYSGGGRIRTFANP